MKRKILMLLAFTVLLTSCANQYKRKRNLEAMYPKCKVEPATGIIQDNGFEFIVIDTTGQIIAINFYPFSETKIMSLRNIR